VPIVSISRLAVLASLGDTPQESLAVLDAGRNEFYARRGEHEWLASYEEIAAAADAGSPLIVAEAILVERLAKCRPTHVGPLDACAAARAALARLRAGEAEDLTTLDANYLRRSDAELFARPVSAPAP
jgi:tRNA threonylcarbamoyladenosine biosynthesis protein TsaB